MEAIEISPVLLGLIPVVMGVVQVIKNLGMDSKFAPILSILLGLGFSFLVGGAVLTVVVGGLVLGLTACGLYAGGKASFS